MFVSSDRKSIKLMEEEGPIGELPEESLVEIVSRLSVREAVRTSVLSKRWRHLWTCIHTLNFSHESLPDRHRRRCSEEDNSNYCEWVSGVLARQRGLNIYEFRVCRALGARYTPHINSWIQFAFANRIHTLELDFSVLDGLLPAGRASRYTLQHPKLYSLSTKFVAFNSLTTVSLKSFNLDDEVLEWFLSNCPRLERLSLHFMIGLRNIKVVGPSLSLRHLEVFNRWEVKSIEICKTNLVSFFYAGHEYIKVVIQNAPKLVDAAIKTYGYYDRLDEKTFPKLSYCFSQLQTLSLNLCMGGSERSMDCAPGLKNLRQFALCVPRDSRRRSPLETFALQCFPIVRNWPNLQSLGITIIDDDDDHLVTKGQKSMRRKERKAARFFNPCLKFVSISGYCKTCDFELLNQIIKNFPALEAITINVTKFDHDKPGWHTKKEERRSVEQQLTAQLPHGVKFIVL